MAISRMDIAFFTVTGLQMGLCMIMLSVFKGWISVETILRFMSAVGLS